MSPRSVRSLGRLPVTTSTSTGGVTSADGARPTDRRHAVAGAGRGPSLLAPWTSGQSRAVGRTTRPAYSSDGTLDGSRRGRGRCRGRAVGWPRDEPPNRPPTGGVVAPVVVVGGLAAVRRFAEFAAVDRVCGVGAVDRFDRVGRVGAVRRLGRFDRVGSVFVQPLVGDVVPVRSRPHKRQGAGFGSTDRLVGGGHGRGAGRRSSATPRLASPGAATWRMAAATAPLSRGQPWGWVMFTIQMTPNLSTHSPYSSPQTWVSSGVTTEPPSDSCFQ
jgi:hypothetical protein